MYRHRLALAGSSAARAAALALALRHRRLRHGSSSSSLSRDTEKSASTSPASLLEATERVLRLLKTREPHVLEDVSAELHWLPPVLSKTAHWDPLGDLVKVAENSIPQTGKVDGSRWISLRLDGTGFSKVVKRLRKGGVLETTGFSHAFADIMRHCCKELMDEFNALVGYTQSDEMIVIIPPASVVRGEQQVHLRAGRVVKLCTVAAGLVTALFNAKIARLCLDKGIEPDACLLSHFDCRLGHYSCWEEARALLLWRAYDCSVNGVSDAVFHAGEIAGRKKAVGLNTMDKLRWLAEHKLLPLPAHQARGSYFVRAKRPVEGYNPVKKEVVTTFRSRVEELPFPVIDLARRDALLSLQAVDASLDEKPTDDSSAGERKY